MTTSLIMMFFITALVVTQCLLLAVSAQSQVCTVSWRNRTNTHSFGATRHTEGVTSAGDCLDHCTTMTTCVAVDIDYKYLPVHCWVYDDASKLYVTAPLFNVVQYRVDSRQCHTRQQACTATWSNRTNTHSFGATLYTDDVTSAGDCLDYCTTKTTCVAVDVDYRFVPVHCWVYDDPSKLYVIAPLYNVNQYRVVSRVCPDNPATTTSTTSSTTSSSTTSSTTTSSTTTTTTTTTPSTTSTTTTTTTPTSTSTTTTTTPITTTRSTTKRSASCRPVWNRFENTNSDGASLAAGYVTESYCLEHCVSRSDCVAVDVNWATRPLQCWVHTSRWGLYYRNYNRYGVNHYELVSRCSKAATPTTPTTTTTPTTSSPTTTTTTPSTTTDVCSATWTRRENTHSYGGSPVYRQSCSSEAGCLSCCVADPHCTAVDVDMTSRPPRCYMYTWPGAVRYRQRAPGVNQFELVSRGDCIAGMSTTTSTTTSASTTTTATMTTTTTTTERTTPTTRRTTSSSTPGSSTTPKKFINTPKPAPGTCPVGNFMCDRGNCLDGNVLCNNVFDCIDLSDERVCAAVCTRKEGISCDNGLCLLPYQRCDGVVDCTDFSDELRCPCGSNYQCRDGSCVPQSWRCDGSTDCSTGEDEIGCTCPSTRYSCRHGPCISRSLVCDGVQDCPAGDDELPAVCGRCAASQFQCRSSYQCVNSRQRCDGVAHCSDASDERLCLRFFVTTAERKKRAATVSGSYPRSWTPLATVYRGSRYYYYFCADRWSRSWSDFACRHMGFQRSDQTYFIHASSSDRLLQRYTQHMSTNLLASFTDTSYCFSRQKVVLNCASKDCGRRTAVENQIDNYVESGFVATDDAWPWHAALLRDGHYQCSATVLSTRWLLTSARCLMSSSSSQQLNVSRLAVRAGSIYLYSHDVTRAQVSRVDRVVFHSSFSASSSSSRVDHDMALVRLSSTFHVTDSVRPVCLHSQTAADAQPGSRLYEQCVVTGWAPSRAASSSVSRQNVLRQVRVTSQPLRHCRQSSRSNLLCVTPPLSNDTCIMNAGAGLVCRHMIGSWTQVAMATTTASDLDGCVPTIFVKLSSTLYSWINSIIGTNS